MDEDGNPIEDKPGYVKATIALVIIGLLLTLAGSFLTGFGLKCVEVSIYIIVLKIFFDIEFAFRELET